MSYILDALKKSDQQRQRGMTPTLHTPQTTVIALRQPAYLFYAIFATILICAGAILGWLHPWQTEQAFPEIKSVPAKPAVLQAQPRNPLPPPEPAAIIRQPVAEQPLQNALPANPVAPVPERPAPQQNTPVPVIPEKAAASPKLKAAPVPEKIPSAKVIAVQHGILAMTELPASIQQEIPKISISGILYTNDPESRLVGINNKLMREGEYLAPDLKLEQIAPDGVIFSYKQYRFRP